MTAKALLKILDEALEKYLRSRGQGTRRLTSRTISNNYARHCNTVQNLTFDSKGIF